LNKKGRPSITKTDAARPSKKLTEIPAGVKKTLKVTAKNYANKPWSNISTRMSEHISVASEGKSDFSFNLDHTRSATKGHASINKQNS